MDRGSLVAQHAIILPALSLIAWTMLIMLWMMVSRFRAFQKAGIKVKELAPGMRGSDLERRLDPKAQWVAHNHNHLMEQPTIFYAICLFLALMDSGAGAAYWLAWTYVALRVLHSIVQTTSNVVLYRSAVYGLASLCLVTLTVIAIVRALQG